MKSMANGGFKPRRDISDFIEWDPRELNSVADFAANMALNLGRDWEKRDPIAIADAKASNAHFRLCSDGSCGALGKDRLALLFTHCLVGLWERMEPKHYCLWRGRCSESFSQLSLQSFLRWSGV